MKTYKINIKTTHEGCKALDTITLIRGSIVKVDGESYQQYITPKSGFVWRLIHADDVGKWEKAQEA